MGNVNRRYSLWRGKLLHRLTVATRLIKRFGFLTVIHCSRSEVDILRSAHLTNYCAIFVDLNLTYSTGCAYTITPQLLSSWCILYHFVLFQLRQIFFSDNLVPRFWLVIRINRFTPFVEQKMPFRRWLVLTPSTSPRSVANNWIQA